MDAPLESYSFNTMDQTERHGSFLVDSSISNLPTASAVDTISCTNPSVVKEMSLDDECKLILDKLISTVESSEMKSPYVSSGLGDTNSANGGDTSEQMEPSVDDICNVFYSDIEFRQRVLDQMYLELDLSINVETLSEDLLQRFGIVLPNIRTRRKKVEKMEDKENRKEKKAKDKKHKKSKKHKREKESTAEKEPFDSDAEILLKEGFDLRDDSDPDSSDLDDTSSRKKVIFVDVDENNYLVFLGCAIQKL